MYLYSKKIYYSYFPAAALAVLVDVSLQSTISKGEYGMSALGNEDKWEHQYLRTAHKALWHQRVVQISILTKPKSTKEKRYM